MTNLQKYAQHCEEQRQAQAITQDLLFLPEYDDEDYFETAVELMKLQAEVF